MRSRDRKSEGEEGGGGVTASGEINAETPVAARSRGRVAVGNGLTALGDSNSFYSLFLFVDITSMINCRVDSLRRYFTFKRNFF